jgi:hypothetical protein
VNRQKRDHAFFCLLQQFDTLKSAFRSFDDKKTPLAQGGSNGGAIFVSMRRMLQSAQNAKPFPEW